MKNIKRYRIFSLLVLISLPLSGFCQGEMALDIGQPINPVDGSINANCDTALFGGTCTPWVRLNFILGPWSSPEDTTLHNGLTWKQTYDEIINRFVAKGIQIYGLIGAEAYTYPVDTLEQYSGPDPNGAEAWINRYTYNFVKIVDDFKDRIRVYESYNEPNNWTNSSTPIVHPAWFARILQEVYLNTKLFNGHNTDPLWQVTLVSGALFTFDLNTGGSYINDTYWYGKNVWAWDWTYAQTGSYPLDGFGQHLYVEQGSSDPTAIAAALNTNIDDFWNNIYAYETDPAKQIWVSEFGWESGIYGETFQSDNLTTAFDVLQNDGRIRLAIWFTLSDFPGGDWGLYQMGSYLPSERKAAFYTFRNRIGCSAITAGIPDEITDKVSISPNPFSMTTVISVGTDLKDAELNIYNVTGEKISSRQHLSGKTIIINRNDMNDGIYLVRIMQEEKLIASEKLIITK